MEALTWFGAIVGVLALLLGLVALIRAVPIFLVEAWTGGTWKVTNQGPPDVVVVKAYVLDEELKQRPLGEFVPVDDYDFQAANGKLLPLGDDPWCKGRSLLAHSPFLVDAVGVGRELRIRYRVRGLFGFLSRSTFRLIGGP